MEDEGEEAINLEDMPSGKLIASVALIVLETVHDRRNNAKR